MKATELMIWDWVLVHKTPQQVAVIEETCISYWAELPMSTELLSPSLSEIEPIPLTPKILEKNGFVHSPNKWDLQNEDEYYPYEIHLEDEGHFLYVEIRTYDVFVQTKLCDVHELQHALRLCGLNDLAENFKI